MMFSTLPLDLESDILSRVPTKSLTQLQVTCKLWYNLFKDPEFVKKNVGKSERQVMFLTNSKVHSTTINHVIHDDDMIDASMEVRGELSSRKKSERVSVSEIFYCDGLVLCTMTGKKMIVVWNPCTGETRSIKPTTCYSSSDDFYALGCGKILRYCYHDNNIAEFEMYEFSSDSWRVLDVDSHDWHIISPAVSMKGNTYWTAKRKGNEFDQFILSFDFTTERFRRVPLPYQNDGLDEIRDDGPAITAVLSVVRDEKLSVLHQYLHRLSVKMKIWVTNNIDEIETKEVSWSKFLVVSFEWIEVVSFLVDEEKKVAVCCTLDIGEKKKTRVFVVGKDRHKQVYEGTTWAKAWPLLLDYVPSLAHIQKNKPKGKRKRETKRHELKKAISVRRGNRSETKTQSMSKT